MLFTNFVTEIYNTRKSFISTSLKHSYTSPHYNVLAGAFFVGRLFPPQVNTFQPLKQGHLSTQDTFSHPKYHSCVQQQIASVTKSITHRPCHAQTQMNSTSLHGRFGLPIMQMTIVDTSTVLNLEEEENMK